MKLLTFLFSAWWMLCLGPVHAAGWDDLKSYELTHETPIIFSPEDNTLVLPDPSGLLTVEDVLKRKDEFKPPEEIGAIDTRQTYWILQKISSHLPADRNYRLEGNWVSIHTHVIKADDSIVPLKTAGSFTGKYSFLSDIDPALPSSAKVQSRDALFTLHSGETLTLLSRAKAVTLCRHVLMFYSL